MDYSGRQTSRCNKREDEVVIARKDPLGRRVLLLGGRHGFSPTTPTHSLPTLATYRIYPPAATDASDASYLIEAKTIKRMDASGHDVMCAFNRRH